MDWWFNGTTPTKNSKFYDVSWCFSTSHGFYRLGLEIGTSWVFVRNARLVFIDRSSLDRDGYFYIVSKDYFWEHYSIPIIFELIDCRNYRHCVHSAPKGLSSNWCCFDSKLPNQLSSNRFFLILSLANWFRWRRWYFSTSGYEGQRPFFYMILLSVYEVL